MLFQLAHYDEIVSASLAIRGHSELHSSHFTIENGGLIIKHKPCTRRHGAPSRQLVDTPDTRESAALLRLQFTEDKTLTLYIYFDHCLGVETGAETSYFGRIVLATLQIWHTQQAKAAEQIRKQNSVPPHVQRGSRSSSTPPTQRGERIADVGNIASTRTADGMIAGEKIVEGKIAKEKNPRNKIADEKPDMQPPQRLQERKATTFQSLVLCQLDKSYKPRSVRMPELAALFRCERLETGHEHYIY